MTDMTSVPDGPPRLVLVHGTLMSSSSWEGYQDLLPDVEIVSIDLPGHGNSGQQEFSTSAALTVIDAAVGDHRPTFLAGHSLGGYFATIYASRRPGKLAGLALLGASGDPAASLARVYRAYAWLVRRVDHRRLARIRDRIARWLGVTDRQLPAAENYAILPEVWQAVFDDCHAGLIDEIDCPVLILNGQFDQMRLGERGYLARAGSGTLRTVKGATHLAPLTHQAAVAQELERFLASVTSGRA